MGTFCSMNQEFAFDFKKHLTIYPCMKLSGSLQKHHRTGFCFIFEAVIFMCIKYFCFKETSLKLPDYFLFRYG